VWEVGNEKLLDDIIIGIPQRRGTRWFCSIVSAKCGDVNIRYYHNNNNNNNYNNYY